MAPFGDYGSVYYWKVSDGIRARFRGVWSDCVQWFPSLAEFRKAARKQIRNKTAHKITEQTNREWELYSGN